MSFAARSLPPADRDETPAPAELPKKTVDMFLDISHDLFAIGSLHRGERDAFLHALDCSANRKPEALKVALSTLKASSERISSLTISLQEKLGRHLEATHGKR